MYSISESTRQSISTLSISKIKNRDYSAVRDFLESYDPIIQKIADRFARKRSYDHDLLVQIGHEAAYNAICKRPLSEENIEPYICRAIRNGIYEECRKNKRIHDLECPLSVYKTRSGEDDNNFDRATAHDGFDEVDRVDALPVIRVNISVWIKELSEQKRKLIGLVFFENMNQSQAAKEMGLTRARVNQLYSEILGVGRIALASIAHLN